MSDERIIGDCDGLLGVLEEIEMRLAIERPELMKPFPDAAGFLSCSRAKIYKLMRSGSLPFILTTTGRFIRRDALVAFAESGLK